MSDFDSNPFADPEATNPFADPSVQQAARPQHQAPTSGFMDDFNPFDNKGTTPSIPPPQAAPPVEQPATLQTYQSPPPYTPSAAQPARPNLTTEDFERRQEELESKEAELRRKEQQLQQNLAAGNRQDNFPPLPGFCPCKPCFFQDFSVDIPLEFQRIVKIMYYLWLFYVCLLLLNVLGCLAYMIVDTNQGGVSFGLSLLYLILNTPLSFICWYRPIYKAFRSDSSFNFFLFFFIFFFQFCATIIYCVGLPGWGTCGWIVGFSLLNGQVAVGAICLIIGSLFSLTAVAQFLVMVKIHRIFRGMGATFAKAQEEFAQGVMTNRTVQTATANAAQTAVSSAFQGNNSSGNRY